MRLNYVAPADHTGYASAAAQYLRVLKGRGVEVYFQPLLPGPGLGRWYECAEVERVQEALQPFCETPFLPEADTILHVVPEYYPALRTWLRERGPTGRIMAMTVWETSRIPRHWPALLNAMDGVIVPSAWNRAVFRESGVTVPIACLGHASEFEGRAAGPEDVLRLRARLPEVEGKFVFYSIGAWSVRKGNDLLIRAYRKAFEERRDVVLILKTTARSIDLPARGWKRLLRKIRPSMRPQDVAQGSDLPQAVLLTEDLSAGEMAAFHGLGDCYVTCSRGEGWGMGLFEAMLYGKPVLAPEGGGHRAYMEDGYSGLVRSVEVPVRMPGENASYTPDQRWFEVDVEAMAGKMREIATQPVAARVEAARIAGRVRERFGAEAIGSKLVEILRGSGWD